MYFHSYLHRFHNMKNFAIDNRQTTTAYRASDNLSGSHQVRLVPLCVLTLHTCNRCWFAQGDQETSKNKCPFVTREMAWLKFSFCLTFLPRLIYQSGASYVSCKSASDGKRQIHTFLQLDLAAKTNLSTFSDFGIDLRWKFQENNSTHFPTSYLTD